MRRSIGAVTLTLLLAAACPAGSIASASPPSGDFDVQVDLENLSGETKTQWPVVMTVYRLFGRNIPPGALDPKGYHVFDPAGKEIECGIEELPPYDQPGNDELTFLIPAMEPGQKLSYRVTNAPGPAAMLKKLDLVGNPNNLLKNAGFEAGQGAAIEGYAGQGVLDTQVKRSGRTSLLLKGAGPASVKYKDPIRLHKGSPYYFGIWGKTENVSRHAKYGGCKGGHFLTTGFPKARGASILPQCGTRDWAKTGFWAQGFTEWGLEELNLAADADAATLEIALDQQKQFFTPPDKTEGRWWLDDAVLMEQPKTTARFDLQLQPHLKDGLFLFTRPTNTRLGRCIGEGIENFCSYPYPREAAKEMDRCALRGQRVAYLLGLYHVRPLPQVSVSVAGGGLQGPEGAKLAVTEIEVAPGFIGPKKSHLLRPLAGPLDLPDEKGMPYFCISFQVPRDAKAGKYSGSLDVSVDGKSSRTVALSLRVQDMEQAVVRDVYVGMIFQGNKMFNEEGMRQYAKSGFTSVTAFCDFLSYKGAGEAAQVDLDDLGKKMEWLRGHGITGAICPFADMDLGPLWGGGRLIKKVGTKQAFQREIKRIEEEIRRHPEWPRMIYMTWDEPALGEAFAKGKHGGPDERMGWVNEIYPDALTTLDVSLKVMPDILKYYTMPTWDNPVDHYGPELYRYFKDIKKDFGLCNGMARGEPARYQPGMLMLASGARYQHVWHLDDPSTLLMNVVDKRVLRSIDMVAAGAGLDDLKAHRLLRDAMDKARAAADPRRAADLKAAEDYVQKISTVWNGDHNMDVLLDNVKSVPYLGLAGSWGYDRFYDDWQEALLRHAAAIRGVKWID